MACMESNAKTKQFHGNPYLYRTAFIPWKVQLCHCREAPTARNDLAKSNTKVTNKGRNRKQMRVRFITKRHEAIYCKKCVMYLQFEWEFNHGRK